MSGSLKTPDQWPDYYEPSNAEWRNGFVWSVNQAAAAVQSGLGATVASQGTAIGTIQSAATATQASLTALAAAATRNPATSDQNMAGHRIVGLAPANGPDQVPRLDQVLTGDGATLWNAGSRRLANLTPGTTGTDAAAFSQLPGVHESTIQLVNGALTLPFQVPTSLYAVWISCASSNAALFLRFSVDGGATFRSLSNDYTYSNFSLVSALAVAKGNSSYVPLTIQSSASVVSGLILIDPTVRSVTSQLGTLTESFSFTTGGFSTQAISGVVTTAVISGIAANLSAGYASITRLT